MSSSISIFVKNSIDYNSFVCRIEDLLAIKFINLEGEPWPISIFKGLGLCISLIGDLNYEDDFGILFSQYSYQIRIEIYYRVEQEEYWYNLEKYLSLYIYSRIIEDSDWKCAVVEDMQKLLARN